MEIFILFVIASVACTITKWLVTDLPRSDTPRFNGFFDFPLLSPIRKLPSASGWKELALDVICIAGILWIGVATSPSLFPFATILFLFCLISSAVDIEHRIIPQELTLPCLVAGLLAGAVVPGFFGETTWQAGVLHSFYGILAGAVGIAIIIEFGKMAFGRMVRDLDPPEVFEFQYGDDGMHVIVADGEPLDWDSLFNRKSDRLIVECTELNVGLQQETGNTLTIGWDTIQIDDQEPKKIDECTVFSGTTNRIIIPREAMGYGDAQFAAVIGAFTGWEGVCFVVFAASIIGSIIGLTLKALGKETTLPFIPSLTLGVLAWFFIGTDMMNHFLGR